MKKPLFKSFKFWILALVVLLVAGRMMLPFYLKDVINSSLAKHLGQYEGSIEDFDLSLYRGAYQLEKLKIQKKNSKQTPLLLAKNIDIALSWKALFRKEISAVVEIDELKVTLTDSEDQNKKQYGAEEDKKSWQSVLQTIIPISVESLVLKNSSLVAQNVDFTEGNAVRLEQINLSMEGLRTRDKENLSPVKILGVLQGHSQLNVEGQMDVLSKPPRANLDLTLKGFKVTTLNKLLRKYVPLDITEGEVEIYSEAIYENSEARGYVKFFMKDGDIIASNQKFISGRHVLIELVSSLANWILKNNESKKVALQVPFHYRPGNFEMKASDAFWSSLHNKFKPLSPKLDDTISFQNKASLL